MENGRITVKQRRLINLYQMIRFQASGSMSVVLPSKNSYKLAAQVLSLLAILLLLSAVTVWEVVSRLDGALPIAYTPVSYTHLDVYKRQVLLSFSLAFAGSPPN